MKEFGTKINNLKSDTLEVEDRKRFLSGIVKDITVTEIDLQRTKLQINFLFPYVGDNLVYSDPNKKTEGYTIKRGSKKQEVEILGIRGAYQKNQKKRKG